MITSSPGVSTASRVDSMVSVEPQQTVTGRAAGRDGRHDGDLVALLERRGGALQEPDVFLVDVDVDEAAQLAAVLDQALLEAGELALERLDQVGDGGGVGLDLGRALGEGAQRGRNANENGHGDLLDAATTPRSWM